MSQYDPTADHEIIAQENLRKRKFKRDEPAQEPDAAQNLGFNKTMLLLLCVALVGFVIISCFLLVQHLQNQNPPPQTLPNAALLREFATYLELKAKNQEPSLQEERDIELTSEPNSMTQAEIRAIIGNMSLELQKLTVEKTALQEELAQTKQELTKVSDRSKIIDLPLPQKTQAKEVPRETRKNEVTQPPKRAEITGWEVVGITSNNVVISVNHKLHALPIGSTLNGVKIQNINVRTGTVQTSHGQLTFRKYP